MDVEKLKRSLSILNVESQMWTCFQVAFFYEDGNPVEPKGVGRKVLDMAYKTYESEMGGKGFAYDGEKTLFTVGPMPMNKLEFTVILENLSSNRYTILNNFVSI